MGPLPLIIGRSPFPLRAFPLPFRLPLCSHSALLTLPTPLLSQPSSLIPPQTPLILLHFLPLFIRLLSALQDNVKMFLESVFLRGRSLPPLPLLFCFPPPPRPLSFAPSHSPYEAFHVNCPARGARAPNRAISNPCL